MCAIGEETAAPVRSRTLATAAAARRLAWSRQAISGSLGLDAIRGKTPQSGPLVPPLHAGNGSGLAMAHSFLTDAVALLLAGAGIAYVCFRLGLVPIVGFLLAGVV